MCWLVRRGFDATVKVRAGICATTLHDECGTVKETCYRSRSFLY
jgi:hypothetical protein